MTLVAYTRTEELYRHRYNMIEKTVILNLREKLIIQSHITSIELNLCELWL